MKKVIRSVSMLLLIVISLILLNGLPSGFEAVMFRSGSRGPIVYQIGVVIYTIIPILIGMLFGIERVYNLRLQVGSWRFDFARLIVIIPLLLISFSFSLYFSNRVIAGIIGPMFSRIDFESSMLATAQLVTGLQVVNAIYKE